HVDFPQVRSELGATRDPYFEELVRGLGHHQPHRSMRSLDLLTGARAAGTLRGLDGFVRFRDYRVDRSRDSSTDVVRDTVTESRPWALAAYTPRSAAWNSASPIRRSS